MTSKHYPMLILSALGCLVGLFFNTPQQRFLAAFVGAALPLAAYYFVKLLWSASVWARHRNWLQFNLRALLIFFVILAVGLAVWNHFLRGFQEQLQLVAAVNRLGGSASISHQGVLISWVGASDDVLSVLAAMPGRRKVKQINFRDSPITDAGIVHLKHFPELAVIVLSRCPVTDKGVKELKAIPRLRGLSLYGCPNITDEGVAWLAERRELRMVNLMNTQVTPAKMQELTKALPYCDVLQNRP